MYFTKFKTLTDELNSYRSACTCGNYRCGGIQDVADFLQTYRILWIFLWDSMSLIYAHTEHNYFSWNLPLSYPMPFSFFFKKNNKEPLLLFPLLLSILQPLLLLSLQIIPETPLQISSARTDRFVLIVTF